MIYCQNCGQQLNDDIKFCYNCGAQVIAPPPPAYEEQPIEPQNQYDYYREPTPSIAQAIVAIALAGEAILMAVITAIYAIPFYVLEVEAGLVFSIIMGIFILPGGIVGLVMGNRYSNSNATRLQPMARAAKILGLISIILLGFTFFIGLMLSA